MHITAGRNSHQETLFARQTPDHPVSVFGFDPKVAIGQRLIVDAGHDGSRHMLQAFQPMEAARGLGRNALDLRQIPLQTATGPDESAARSQGGHEMRNAAAGLLDNLGAGGVEMRFPVRGVVVLVGIEIQVRLSLKNLAYHADRPIRAFPRVAKDHLRTVSLQNALALAGGVRRQYQFHLVAAVGADHGIGDTGIAAGGIKDSPITIQLAGTFALDHHIARRAVLYRAARIKVFGLPEDLDSGELARDFLQTQQWCIADRVE